MSNRTKWLVGGLLLLNLILLFVLVAVYVRKKRDQHSSFQGIPSVIARVDGRPIYARDLFSATQFTAHTPDGSQFREALHRLVIEEIVAHEARKFNGINLTEEAMENIGYQFNDSEDEQAALQRAGLDKKEVRERLARHFQIVTWLQEQTSSKPTEAECRAWYASHPQVAALPAVVQATHFAAVFPPSGEPAGLLEKGDLIRDIQSRLAEGIPFQQLIDSLSDDPAKPITHGSLDWFGRERMEPALIEAAFTQPLGVVGPPVPTRLGFHLMRVDARRAAVILPYEEVAEEVRQRCRAEIQRKKIEVLVTGLQLRAKVEILDPAFRN